MRFGAMRTTSNKKSSLPLVRLSMVTPFVRGLESLGIPVNRVLEPLGFSGATVVNDAIFVPAITMYEIVETLSDASGDAYFGVHVGETLNPRESPMLAPAIQPGQTLGDFLVHFSVIASQNVTSVVFSLETNGARSRFAARRLAVGDRLPRHNDGFTMAYILPFLQCSAGDAWRGDQVIVHVCDPAVVPPDYLGVRLASTDSLGFQLSFPTDWLLLKLQLASGGTRSSGEIQENLPSGSIREALHQALQAHLREPNLTVERIARLCGMSKRTLARRLTVSKTTVQRELAHLRRLQTERELLNTRTPIAEIGLRVGYTDPTVFARAFKRWTGDTPSEFRKKRSLKLQEPAHKPARTTNT